MAPRLNLLRHARLIHPTTIHNASVQRLTLPIRQQRNITPLEKPLPTKDDQDSPGSNQTQLGHVSEEAADTAQIMGETAPEQEIQGTPVQEVLARSEKGKENAPQVMKDESKASGLGEAPSMSSPPSGGNSGKAVPKGTRSYSTTARRRAQELTIIPGDEQFAPAMANPGGHIFPLPELPLASHLHLRHRYEPLVEQMTNLLMRDGKKAAAQRVRHRPVTPPSPTICNFLELIPRPPLI